MTQQITDAEIVLLVDCWKFLFVWQLDFILKWRRGQVTNGTDLSYRQS